MTEFVRQSEQGRGSRTVRAAHVLLALRPGEADPDVRRDLDEFFRRLVPPGDDPAMKWLRHTTEGPDDMPAYIRAALNAVSLSIPVADSRLVLGT